MIEPERCCPAGLCAFRAQRVRQFIRVVRALKSAGLDVGEHASSVLAPYGGYEMGRTQSYEPANEAKWALMLDAVQKAMTKARTVDEAAKLLCPFAPNDEEGE